MSTHSRDRPRSSGDGSTDYIELARAASTQKMQQAVASTTDRLIAVEAKRLQEARGLAVNVAWLVASQSASYVGQVLP